MPRARVIQPRLLDSPLVEKLGAAGAFFFVGMLLISDDFGRLRGSTIYLKRSILGGVSPRTSSACVTHWLSILYSMGTAYPYTDADGGEFIQITNWKKYQRLSHPTPSKIPAPTPDQIPEIDHKDSGAFSSREKRREEKGGGPPSAAQPPPSTPLSEPPTSPAGERSGAAPVGGTPAAPASAPVDEYDEWLRTATPEEIRAQRERTAAIVKGASR